MRSVKSGQDENDVSAITQISNETSCENKPLLSNPFIGPLSEAPEWNKNEFLETGYRINYNKCGFCL